MIVTIGGIPVYNAVISDDETGMMKISLVDDPAVMTNFEAFDNMKQMQLYAIQNEEKRLVRGVVMRADFPIYRMSANMGEYYIIYKAEQIRKMAEKYLVESRQNNVNTMHTTDVEGVQMVQYFIKGDGISIEGFDGCADGSLFAEFHILNDEVWSAVKDGTYRGFSLEGYFGLAPEENADEVSKIVDKLNGNFSKTKEKHMTKLSKIKAALAKMLQEFGNITTDRGILAWDNAEDIQVGDAVYIESADNERTPAEDGEYVAEDGRTIVVAEGIVTEIRDAEQPAAEEVPEAEAEMRSIDTDKGVIAWSGEEDVRVGDEVFVQEGEEFVPAPTDEYITDRGYIVVVEDGIVTAINEIKPVEEENPVEVENSALKAEVAQLKAEVAKLKMQVAKMSKMSAAKPAHEEVKVELGKTGIRGLDNLAKILKAK